MRLADKNKAVRNLRAFIDAGNASDLDEHQVELLETAHDFLVFPKGKTFFQRGTEAANEEFIKKGDYFEAVSATGTGKTRMFGTMAKAMDIPTLIVTPRKILNEQAKEEFCKEIGFPENQTAVYDSDRSKAELKRVLEGNPPPKFVITSYRSLQLLLEKHELEMTNPKDPHYRPLIILDEVQEGQGS